MSCHLTSCYVLSYHVMTCHVISRLALLHKLDTYSHNMSCHLTSSHVLSYHVMSCHVMSCHVMSCHVMSCHVMSCHVLSCHVMSCHVMSSHVFSRLVTSCHIMSSCFRILLPNLSSEPSKFFYYGGGVAPTRFSKPWPCAGIRLGATLSLWRRAHCERARVAPCTFLRPAHRFAWQAAGIGRVGGVPRVCRGCAAGVPRRSAVGIGFRGAFCVRIVNVRFAWQAAGVVRAGRCAAGVPRACWRRRAVGIGFGACRARA